MNYYTLTTAKGFFFNPPVPFHKVLKYRITRQGENTYIHYGGFKFLIDFKDNVDKYIDPDNSITCIRCDDLYPKYFERVKMRALVYKLLRDTDIKFSIIMGLVDDEDLDTYMKHYDYTELRKYVSI